MLKDVTLGQFFPGSSIVHRLDPRCKLLLTIVYIAALFTAQSYVSYAVMLIVTGVCIALSRIPLKVILRGLKPLWIIIALTAVLNIFFTPGRELVSFWKITITYEGLVRAVFMVLRITMLIAGTFLLTYTTSPIALTDAMEILFGPLKKLKVPVHEMSMMMSMALRFIPRSSRRPTRSCPRRKRAAPILRPATSFSAPGRCCRCSCRCSCRHSAARTSWPWPWSAAAITATRAARA